MIRVRGMRHHLIDIERLDVEGNRVALIGPNGAGKTTLLEVLAGMDRIREGSATVLGKSPHEVKVGWVGEFPDRTMLFSRVCDEVASSLRFTKVEQTEADRIVLEAMAMLGRPDLLKRYTRSLSGGEKALVAFAAAIVNSPDILILDEVDSHLDEATVKMIADAVQRSGIPTLFCTQDMDRAATADHVIFLRDGKVEFSGPPAEVFGQLQDGCFYPSLWRLSQ